MTTLRNLSNELLVCIISHLVESTGCDVSTLIPLSSSCHRIRELCYPVLFRNLKLIFKASCDQAEPRDLLCWLSDRPHIQEHVRQIDIHQVIQHESRGERDRVPVTCVENSPSRTPFPDSLSLLANLAVAMPRLRRININYVHWLSARLTKALKFSANIEFKLLEQSPSHWADYQGRGLLLRSVSPWLQQHLHVSIDSQTAVSQWFSWAPSLLGFADPDACLAVQTHNHVDFTFPHDFDYFRPRLINLVELHLLEDKQEIVEDRVAFYHAITPWESLLRLNVDSTSLYTALFPSVLGKLQQLQTLRIGCKQLKKYPCPQNCRSPDGTPVIGDDTLLECKRLPKLLHFDADFVCSHTAVKLLVNPRLISLQLVSNDRICEHSTSDRDSYTRSCADIKWLATHVPKLERLGINITDLRNLWNPFAIIGVDISVEVYTLLEALSRLPRLEVLRLYPPYFDTTTPLRQMVQPVTDEQAVKIFQYFRQRGSRLKVLFIGPTFIQDYSVFSPMTWIVRDAGNGRTLLTTYQERRSYEMEQVWIGDRKVSSRTRTYVSHRSWLPPVGDWEIPMAYEQDLRFAE